MVAVGSVTGEFKIWRRQRQRQRHKSMIWLVVWGKIIVLHVQHAFWCHDVKFSYLRFCRQLEPAAGNLSFSAFTWKPFVPSKRKYTSPSLYNITNLEYRITVKLTQSLFTYDAFVAAAVVTPLTPYWIAIGDKRLVWSFSRVGGKLGLFPYYLRKTWNLSLLRDKDLKLLKFCRIMQDNFWLIYFSCACLSWRSHGRLWTCC